MTTSISVIIPVHNGARVLSTCLDHLAKSNLPLYEIIVADDGSTDGSAAIAQRYGARLVSSGAQQGPARARNLGASAATGEVLLFLDADVAVHKDTLQRIETAFRQDPDLHALIGSYDDSPAEADFLSQYRNLMHCFVHNQGKQDASTFWSGCGAIRRDVFTACSGFSENYARPSIEDIELGYRLRHLGYRILLDPAVQVKHLKRWTLTNIIRTDVLDRGVPWTELILRDKRMPDDLNLKLSQRVSVALVYVVLGLAALCAFYWRALFLAPLFALLFFVLGRYWLDPFAKRSAAVQLWTAAIFSGILVIAWWTHLVGLVPLILTGAAALFVRHRYSRASQGWIRLLSVLMFSGCILATALLYMPYHPLLLAFQLTVIALVILNSQFYLFLAGRRGKSFAMAAIPLHLLYHAYNGISFVTGAAVYLWRRSFARTLPPARSSPR